MQTHESRIHAWRTELDWQHGDYLCLDVDDVLSKKSCYFDMVEDDPPFEVADPGAVAFLVFYKIRYGQRLRVSASRVNMPFKSWSDTHGREHWHWIVRLLDAIGLLDMGVKWDSEQSAHLKTVKAMVASDFENLWHIGMDAHCQNCRLIQYNNNGFDSGKFNANTEAERWDAFSEISDKVMAISSWYDLAL